MATQMEGTEEEKRIRRFIKLGVGVFAALLVVIFLNPVVVIGAGHRGIVMNWGAVQSKILGEGLHFRTPFMQKVVEVDVRNIKHEVEAIAYSKDIQTVDAKVALNYHLDPNLVNLLWQEIGPKYEPQIIDPAIQEGVKAATAQFTAQQLIEERPRVKEEIRNQLMERLNGRHIIVDDFSIVNFDFSDEYENAVEDKQVAQQSALKAENDLIRIKTEAEQRIAQAIAEAEAIRIQAESISNQGGAEYVQLKRLEVEAQAVSKWNGQLPQQFVPGSALPFLNLSPR